MDVILFSERLRRLLAGDEGKLPDGVKEQIQAIQNEIDFMVSFLREREIKLQANEILLFRNVKDLEEFANKKNPFVLLIEMIFYARTCEMSIDQCIIAIMQQKNEIDTHHEDLCLEIPFFTSVILADIKQRMSEVQVKWIQTDQACNSSSSSGTVKRDKELVIEKPSMEGLENKMEELLDLLIEGEDQLLVVAIVESNELKKTNFATEAYNSTYVKNYFDCHAWITVTLDSSANKILEDIMKSVMLSSDWSEIMGKDFQLKITTLRDYLRSKKYFIVLDDIWDIGTWDFFKEILPDDKNGSRVLSTFNSEGFDWSRFDDGEKIGAEADGMLSAGTPLRVVYGGLPFVILHFGQEPLIRKNKQSLEELHWLKMDPYHNLPFYLKPCFLYLSVFPENIQISTRHLYQLWIAEGFIQDNSVATAEKYLEELIDRGLLQVIKTASGGRVKTCYTSGISKFLSIFAACMEMLMAPDDSLDHSRAQILKILSIRGDSTKFVSRQLPFPNNIRSLLCLVPNRDNFAPMDCNYISENFKLLIVLDLGTLVVNQLPVGIENLLLLRYLKLNIPSLTSIPSSLCNLLNLYTLDMPYSHIVHTADDFWKMCKLKYLNFGCINLLAQSGIYYGYLKDVTFISALNPHSCTRDVLNRLPNLQSLRIFGNLSSYGSVLSNTLCELLCLESLKLVNETNISQHSLIALSEYHFPPRLTHLSLSNMKLKDDPMPTLEKLPHLQVLKLKHNAYLGRKMACSPDGFPSLKVLHLKSMLWLQEWTVGAGAMLKLECLIINPSAYLRKLPEELWRLKTFRKLELWWPQPELKQRLREFEDMERYDIQIYPFGS